MYVSQMGKLINKQKVRPECFYLFSYCAAGALRHQKPDSIECEIKWGGMLS